MAKLFPLEKPKCLRSDELNFWKLPPDHRARTVYRVVVDDKFLPCSQRPQALHPGPHRQQALRKEVLNVVIDNDDGNVHGLKLDVYGKRCFKLCTKVASSACCRFAHGQPARNGRDFGSGVGQFSNK